MKSHRVYAFVLALLILLFSKASYGQVYYTNLICTNSGSGTKICVDYLSGLKGGLNDLGPLIAGSLNRVLIHDGIRWSPTIFQLTGDVLSAAYPATTVVALQNRPVSSSAPASGDALVWTGSQWAPQALGTQLYQAITDSTVAACDVAKLVPATGHVALATGNASTDGDLVIGIYIAAATATNPAVVAKIGATVTCTGLTNGMGYRDSLGKIVTYGSLGPSVFTQKIAVVGSTGAQTFVTIGDTQQVP